MLLRSRLGKTALIVLSTIFSAEGGLALMRMAEWKFGWALVVVILSHAVNLGIDYIASVWLLKIPWFKASVQIVSEYGNMMIAKISELLPWRKAKKQTNVDMMERIKKHLDDLHTRKSFWVYVIIFSAAGVPKPPIPFLPGWTAPAVFFIRYNRLGFRGWLPLCLGLTVRTSYVMAIAYSLVSF